MVSRCKPRHYHGSRSQGTIGSNARGPEEFEFIAVQIARTRTVECNILIREEELPVRGRRYLRVRFRVHPYSVGLREIVACSEPVIRPPPDVVVRSPVEFDLHYHLRRISSYDSGRFLPGSEFVLKGSLGRDGIFHRGRLNTNSVVKDRYEAFNVQTVRCAGLIRREIPVIYGGSIYFQVELIRHAQGISHEIGSPEHDEVVRSFLEDVRYRYLVCSIRLLRYAFRVYLHPLTETARSGGGKTHLEGISINTASPVAYCNGGCDLLCRVPALMGRNIRTEHDGSGIYLYVDRVGFGVSVPGTVLCAPFYIIFLPLLKGVHYIRSHILFDLGQPGRYPHAEIVDAVRGDRIFYAVPVHARALRIPYLHRTIDEGLIVPRAVCGLEVAEHGRGEVHKDARTARLPNISHIIHTPHMYGSVSFRQILEKDLAVGDEGAVAGPRVVGVRVVIPLKSRCIVRDLVPRHEHSLLVRIPRFPVLEAFGMRHEVCRRDGSVGIYFYRK